METVLMKLEIFQALMERMAEKIDGIERFIHVQQSHSTPNTDEVWLDKDTVCAYLKISRRTLQRYRSDKTISYSMVGKKSYYALSEIRRLLRERCIPHNEASLRELSEKASMSLPKD